MAINKKQVIDIEAECDFCKEKSRDISSFIVLTIKNEGGVFHIEDEATKKMTGFELFPIIGSKEVCFCSKGCQKKFLERELTNFIS